MDKTTHEVRLQQWHEIIQAQLASGQNKRAWCRENGISEKQFFYWQRRVRKEIYERQQLSLAPAGSAAPCARLVEVPIIRSASSPATEGFRPEAVIAIGNVTVGVSGGISEALLMSIGKMIRYAL
ncbi:MAG: hypothetical protein IJI41_13735 [Anaerolineaceae bacterium]|nr:IS66 family insertion sequence element accessory protein TnpB [Oscillospiraceae bacterium]MBQ3466090.1 IS66 family insertion sequence element accessory protein TnpB [Bacillota bacterium]MBQ6344179.1 hypothetical protein [Anaerolineaceae bacterium]